MSSRIFMISSPCFWRSFSNYVFIFSISCLWCLMPSSCSSYSSFYFDRSS